MSATDTRAENVEMNNNNYPDDDVRIEDQTQHLEGANPEKGSRADVWSVIEEAGGTAGADNTGEPAGANVTHTEDETGREGVADSDVAKNAYEGKEITKPGVTGA
jgi:hypothetical protein